MRDGERGGWWVMGGEHPRCYLFGGYLFGGIFGGDGLCPTGASTGPASCGITSPTSWPPAPTAPPSTCSRLPSARPARPARPGAILAGDAFPHGNEGKGSKSPVAMATRPTTPFPIG